MWQSQNVCELLQPSLNSTVLKRGRHIYAFVGIVEKWCKLQEMQKT
jgi:hypothetical protein